MIIQTSLPEDLTPAQFRFQVKCMLDGLALGACPLFAEGLLPGLFESGIVFQFDPDHGSGVENFVHPALVYQRGWGDCDQLCWYRVAELRSKGIKATVTISDYHDDGGAHAQVRLPMGFKTAHSVSTPRGAIEDPAMLLGAQNHWPTAFLYDQER